MLSADSGQDQAGEDATPAHLDGGDGEGDLPPTINVRVENTKDVLELLWDHERLLEGKKSKAIKTQTSSTT